MTPKQQQRGLTMWSAIFVIGIVVFFLFLFFKLLPPYLNDMNVKNAIDGLAADPDVAQMSKRDLIVGLAKRFDINDVTNVDPDKLTIEANGKSRVIHMSYEVVVPLAYNVSALLDFDHVRQLPATQ